MRKNIIMLSACLCIVMFAACDPNDEGKSAFADDSINIVKVTEKALLSPYEEDITAAGTVARGANDFAFRLGAALVKDAGDKNFVCSPYSVWLPLAALLNATDEQNKAALTEALGASGIGVEDINKAASRMLYNLTKMQDKDYELNRYYNPLKIANAIFVDNAVTLKNDFAQTFMDFYRGASINVDFSSQNAVDAVNRWASENTGGLIKNLIKEFDPETVVSIANAIYFSDRWDSEFDPDETKKDVFHAKGGDSKAFYMLREGKNQIYYEDDRLQAIWLSFKHGGGMYIVLPRDGDAAALLSSITNEYFNEIMRGADLSEGKLLLPRFSIENDISDLKEALKSLGIPLFVGAPLTGLIEELPLVLTSAKQRALIKVDEKGTTAAAVTIMDAGGSARPRPSIPFEMICDRPFVFILYDNTYDGGRQILFTGVVNKP
ncbi:MAG: hypothetical protein LBU82_04715 [Treponema sp.]|jgi:serpin B|nr:hypothetical protein [Treponema sp.]